MNLSLHGSPAPLLSSLLTAWLTLIGASVLHAATYRFELPFAGYPVRHALITDTSGNVHVAAIDTTDGVLTIRLPQRTRIVVHFLCTAGRAGTLMVTADNRGLGYEPDIGPLKLLSEVYISATGQEPAGMATEALLSALGEALVAREDRLLESARAAIRVRRLAEHRVQLLMSGEPVPNTQVSVEQQTLNPLLGFGQGFYEKTAYCEATRPLFDYVVLPFYLRGLSPEPDFYDWAPLETTARWCMQNHIEVKGHPLVWFYESTMVRWVARLSYPDLKQWIHEHVVRNVSHFKGLIDRWDVINEAHGWANCLRLSPEQLLELTDIAVRAAKQANPGCQTVVNCCLPWGDNLQMRKDSASLTPYEYYRRLIKAGCPFDVVGIQLYDAYAPVFPHRDLTAMSALLDRFSNLGREIHVTEFATPSGGPAWGVWRGSEWTPELQAGYTRGFYEVAAAKPLVKSINWWFPIDVPGTDWDHLGLVDAAARPKPVLEELIAMKRSWLTSMTARTDADGWVTFSGLPGSYSLSWQSSGRPRQSSTVRIAD